MVITYHIYTRNDSSCSTEWTCRKRRIFLTAEAAETWAKKHLTCIDYQIVEVITAYDEKIEKVIKEVCYGD